VLFGRDKQPLLPDVNCHVVEGSTNSGQRNCLNEHEGAECGLALIWRSVRKLREAKRR